VSQRKNTLILRLQAAAPALERAVHLSLDVRCQITDQIGMIIREQIDLVNELVEQELCDSGIMV